MSKRSRTDRNPDLPLYAPGVGTPGTYTPGTAPTPIFDAMHPPCEACKKYPTDGPDGLCTNLECPSRSGPGLAASGRCLFCEQLSADCLATNCSPPRLAPLRQLIAIARNDTLSAVVVGVRCPECAGPLADSGFCANVSCGMAEQPDQPSAPPPRPALTLEATPNPAQPTPAQPSSTQYVTDRVPERDARLATVAQPDALAAGAIPIRLLPDLLEIADVISGAKSWCVVDGDSYEILAMLRARLFSVTITDPPYDERTHKGVMSRWRGGDEAGRPLDVDLGFGPLTDYSIVCQMLRVTQRWVTCFCAMMMFGKYEEAAKLAGEDCWVRDGIWHRRNPAPQFTGDRPGQGCEGVAIMHAPRSSGKMQWNGGGKQAYWESPIELGEERIHPSQKPLKVCIDLVKDFSNPGEVILDPFGGAMSVGKAALRYGRRVVCIERNDAWKKWVALSKPEVDDPPRDLIAEGKIRLKAEEHGNDVKAEKLNQSTIFDEIKPKDG